MQFVELHEVCRLEPRADTIWQTGDELHWQQADPFCVVGVSTGAMVNRHRQSKCILPAPGVYRLRDAEVHGRGCVKIGDSLLGGESWPGIGVFDGPAKRLLHTTPRDYFADKAPALPVRRVPGRSVLLSHSADHIYGHWLLDIFPVLWMAKRSGATDGARVIVRSDAPSYIDAWLLAAGFGPDAIIRHDVHGEILLAEELVVGTYLRVKEYVYPEMAEYGDWFRGIHVADLPPRASDGSRLYVSRSGIERTRRNLINRPEIEEKFAELGFEVYRPETDTIETQIRKFSKAGFIIGESGSGLHNSLFSPSDTMVCALTSQKRLNLIQSALCQARNQRISYIVGTAFDRAGLGSTVDFHIPPDDVDVLLEQCGTV